ncbi:hypothetical protein QYF36_016601 [Acer negundo]|nr:hypothetical protein QYF36_016601 [Acer negundo]
MLNIPLSSKSPSFHGHASLEACHRAFFPANQNVQTGRLRYFTTEDHNFGGGSDSDLTLLMLDLKERSLTQSRGYANISINKKARRAGRQSDKLWQERLSPEALLKNKIRALES